VIYLELALAIGILSFFFYYKWLRKKEMYELESLEGFLLDRNTMKQTLAMGLYTRFSSDSNENKQGFSSIFINEDPHDFEYFVAEIIEKTRGGSTYVTRATGDFGVDFEHKTSDGLFLGQVKCYKGDLSYEPIALIHSNMIKTNAFGGYVVTTGSFSKNARKYAQGLNIELIDGVELVNLWLESVTTRQEKEVLLRILSL